MDDTMDVQTWTIVIAVVLVFFALPAGMLVYDLRRRRAHRIADNRLTAREAPPTPLAPLKDGGRRDSKKRSLHVTQIADGSTPRQRGVGRPPSPTDAELPDRR